MTVSEKARLLIIDNETELMTALCEMLAKHGYETVGFTSATDGLRALRERDFDLMLTDLTMPETDGIEALKAGLEIDPHLIGIIMTGQGTVPTAVEAMKQGAFDYVLKPFKLNTLVPVLARALEMRRLRMENFQLREMNSIYEFSKAMAQTLDLDTVLQKVADAALEQCEADEASILLPTEHGDELFVAVVCGDNREHILGERVPFGQGIAGWVARHRKPLVLDGEVTDPQYLPLKPRESISSAVSMPMMVGNKLVGVVNLNITQRRRTFTPVQIKALLILVNTGAFFVENASLYTQLAKAEEKYRSIFANAVEGMYQATPDGRFITANASLARILGYESTEELFEIVTSIKDQLHVDPSQRTRLADLARQHGSFSGAESRMRRKDGSEIWVSESVRCVIGEDGLPLYYEGMLLDVTPRRQAEEALKRSDEQYKLLLSHINDVVYTINAAERPFEDPVQLVSDQVTTILGYSPEEFIEEPGLWYRLLHPNDVSLLVEKTKELFAKRIGATRTYRLRHKTTGEYVWLEDRVVPKLDSHGMVVGLFGVARDITDRLEAEEALKESKRFLEAVVDTAPNLMILTDPEGRIVLFNRACEALTGYAREEVLGKTVSETLLPEAWASRVEQDYLNPYSPETIEPHEYPCRTKTGEERAIEWRSTILVSPRDGKPYVLATGVDVTEQKLQQMRLLQSQKMESIGTLAGGIAHDFNNLLTGIIGFAELSTLTLTPESQCYSNLQEILRLGERAARLTRQLLTFARKQAFEPKQINLTVCISELGKFLRRVIGEHIQLELHLGSEPIVVNADDIQIEQLLLNLCINARDAMPGGGRLIVETQKICVDELFCRTHSEATPGKYALLSVSDTGIGMDAQTQEKIFEPFFTTKELSRGTGLGLSTVYGIIKRHGGFITVQSEVGRGTSFDVYLPVLDVEAGTTPEAASEAPLGGTETILVAEDEAEVRNLIIGVLLAQGYRVLPAVDGEDAVLVFEESQEYVDLVLSDAVMPKVGGRELYSTLRSRNPSLKFLFVSGYSAGVLSEKFILEEGVDLLHKPFSAIELAHKVRDVLDR